MGIKSFLRRFADHMIESPCIAVCKMNPATGLCSGCFRTIEEIAGWPELNGEQKRKVIALSAERKASSASP